MRKKVVVDTGDFEFKYTYDKTVPSDLDNNHCHDNYEMLFVVSGEGKYIVEGTYFDIKPVTLMIIRPFEFHCVKLNPDVPYERYVVNFSLSDLDETTANKFRELVDGDDNSSGRYFAADLVPREVFAIFDRFEFALMLPEIVRSDYLKLLLAEIILFLSVNEGEYMAHNEEELGAKVIRYLNENLTRNISLDKLARRFFVSKFHLCRAFKKHNGISVHGYINQKRVVYAKQLIEAGETASGAAYRVGFGDYSSFYRAYVKLLGKSPTAD